MTITTLVQGMCVPRIWGTGGGRVGSSLTAGGPRSSIRTFEELYRTSASSNSHANT